MHAPVVNHAASVFFYASPAVKHLPGTLNTVFQHINVSEQSFLIYLFNNVIICVPAPVLMGCEQTAGYLGKLHKLSEFLCVHCGGLFQYNVFASEHCLFSQGLVKIIGGGYYYNAYLWVGEHFLIRGIGVNAVLAGDLHSFLAYVVSALEINFGHAVR